MVERRQRDWYSVSVDTLRLGIGGILLVLAGVGGVFGYQRWEQHAIEQRAFEVVAKSEGLLKQLKTEEDLPSYREEYNGAAERYREADRALTDGNYREARSLGEESLARLQSILDRIRHRGQSGIAWFVSVEGDVQYRRGESGSFVTARARDELYPGDYVRSSGSGSAEIYFTYEDARFTIGPGALYQLPRTRGGSEEGSFGFMEYGWVALNTSQNTSGISTKYSDVTVDRNSQARVSLPRNSSRSQVAVTRGGAAVKSSRTGEVRRLGELEQVTQTESKIGPTTTLPSAPLLLDPPDNLSINIDNTKELQLTWDEVEGARSYAFQISRSRLFSDNILDTDESKRNGTSAKLQLVEEGSYLWRVAAYNRGGEKGPWSEYRKFRVESFRDLSLEEDEIPPELDVQLSQSGNIVILSGRTEPGASLELNGEAITVNADGSFSTSKQLFGRDEEWVSLTLRARDERGNATTVRRRVFVTSL